ncbi:ABC transporter ATP-binding protein [Thermus scotoductus]|uniref:ABC transporter ATP-binding protein n=1 Tax=Thermus scotoductus TaxID=37636 RepID=A0A430UNA0_THESC|nr:ABC transporter ATP-binding protein [Thermus scotoductus]RTG96623.1 ABC transporter ATP-binding protein [Thermus scotoductus]RTH11774.1 ABC transporter ATP-binding protein [Thermus scotoductus]RTH12660.1 ABC transporter ATP-binding protein [Thermus scotoductus]RTH13441.1 ABC transporter ATP-binding protein [Thermus scotoductus]RTH18904.1 ABC transporter ATP-binding protein [Thermus scotoductus]
MAVIETHGLTKRYGRVVAVEDLNLEVQEGEVFGLLGPNGSGKTTTILMLLGLTEPTRGEARVLGLDPMREPLKVKSRVGYLPDQVGFYGELTAWENLRYTTRLLGLPEAEARARIEEVLKRMGLWEVRDRRVSAFSRGMRQRLGLAEVLLKRPKVAILDEPTLGLDPEAAREFLELIKGLKAEGITILLSSHLLHQVQEVCDRVGLFHKGHLALLGTVEELALRVLGGGYEILVEASPGLEEAFRRLEGVARVAAEGGRYRILSSRDLRPELARIAVEQGELLSLSLRRPSLDEVYAHYFKEVAHAA